MAKTPPNQRRVKKAEAARKMLRPSTKPKKEKRELRGGASLRCK
jgi:hypothetical protein